MKIKVDENFVQGAHENIHRDAQANGGSDRLLRMSKRYVEGHWKRFIPKVELFSRPIADGVFLDYGCKFGHLVPLLMDQKVRKVFAVDVDDDYLREGKRYIGNKFPVQYEKSKDCFVDIESQSIDFILVNEVISHINPSILDNFYAELARVLKSDGELIISDGNNWAHLPTRLDLLQWYSLWENGTSKEFGDRNYVSVRKTIIARHFPQLDSSTVEYLAVNTSGLYGDQICNAVERFQSGSGFVPRPHRPGVSPTNPNYGVVMERAFDPRQILIALETYGIDAVQLLRGKPLHADEMRGSTKNFTIRGTKIPETIEALSEHARRTLAPNESGKTSSDLGRVKAGLSQLLGMRRPG